MKRFILRLLALCGVVAYCFIDFGQLAENIRNSIIEDTMMNAASSFRAGLNTVLQAAIDNESGESSEQDPECDDGVHYYIPCEVRHDMEALQEWRKEHNFTTQTIPDEINWYTNVLYSSIGREEQGLRTWATFHGIEDIHHLVLR